MRGCWLALLVLTAGCGGSHVTPGPSPLPTPTPVPASITVTANLTNTVTGAPVGTQTTTVATLPARLTLTQPGFLARELTVTSATPTVDLIPDAAPFDLTFYRQLTRGALDGQMAFLSTLPSMPSIYLQTAGLTAANVATLEQAARLAVPAFTGGKFAVGVFQAGADPRPEQDGWIVIDIISSTEPCGRSRVGDTTGHIWLNVAPRCAFGGEAVYHNVLAHELGHALGFSHVDRAGSMMRSAGGYEVSVVSDTERYHAAIAYHRPRGNMDVDRDPVTPITSASRRVIE